MVVSSSELWLPLPPPLEETRPCSQISSQLSKHMDITDVKSVLRLKRLQHRNIINYPPVFHHMTSLISAVPDRAVFVVTGYVYVCTCVRVSSVYVFGFAFMPSLCVCECMFVCLYPLCICVTVFCVHLKQNKPLLLVFTLVWSCHQINLSFLQVI